MTKFNLATLRSRLSSATVPLIAAAVMAVTAPAVEATDLMDVYEAAKDDDPVLGAARASFAASQQAVPQARAGILPSLNASANTSFTDREFPGVPTLDEQFNEHGWNAQISQPLLDMNAWFSLGSAKANVAAAEFDLAASEQELIVRVVQAYLNVLRAQDLLETTLAEEAAVKRQLDQVQQRFDVGLVAITDVLESQAAYDNAVVRRIQADGDYDIFFETLSTLTGIAYEALDRLSDQLPIVDPNPMDEQAWVANALDQNLGVLAAQKQLTASRKNVQARRSGHYPTIDATVTRVHNVTGARNFFGADTTDQTVYGLQFNLPIYNGGAVRARTKEASALAEQAQEILYSQQRTVTRDTRNLYQAVSTDVVRVKARLKAIASSQSALDATQTGYEVGTRNIVDVLQAQQRLFASQFDYAESRYNYVINLMRLKQVAGVLAEPDLEELNGFTDPNDQVKRVVSLSGSP